MKSKFEIIQMKVTDRISSVVLFVKQYNVALTFELAWRDATGSNWKYIKECGVVDPAFLSYLNFDQGAAKAIGVKIRRFRCQQAFLLPETHCYRINITDLFASWSQRQIYFCGC